MSHLAGQFTLCVFCWESCRKQMKYDGHEVHNGYMQKWAYNSYSEIYVPSMMLSLTEEISNPL